MGWEGLAKRAVWERKLYLEGGGRPCSFSVKGGGNVSWAGVFGSL